MTKQKKVCMLGAFAVGKTSLVARFVKGIFDERYLTTVGVKTDRKDVAVGDETVRMVLWDIQGEDELQPIKPSYMTGASGCLLVVDGTRPETLDVARRLKIWGEANAGPIPFVMLLNKVDLTADWALQDEDLQGDNRPGCRVIQTSAKTGEGVEDAFRILAEKMTAGDA
ncbi:MAG: Rab family GTPase [Planctomycetota bacterium]|nr:Rab family GTPase [Planctomycetota bacterium]